VEIRLIPDLSVCANDRGRLHEIALYSK